MAIQPIDLQALFSQIDKVGKTQTELKEGVEIQQGILNANQQKKIEQKVRSVNETDDAGEGLERIKDRKPRKKSDTSARDDRGEGEDDEPEEKRETVTDPNLGRNVDLSG